jgi:hypothetical protein
MKKPTLERIAKGSRTPAREAAAGQRKAWFGGKAYSTRAFRRDALRAGNADPAPDEADAGAMATPAPAPTCGISR